MSAGYKYRHKNVCMQLNMLVQLLSSEKSHKNVTMITSRSSY